jgi:hypothetical protein
MPGLDGPLAFSLSLADTVGFTDLSVLGAAPNLRHLYLTDLPGVTSLAGATDLSGLQGLVISHLDQLADLDGLAATPQLTDLEIADCPALASVVLAAGLGDDLELALDELPALTTLGPVDVDSLGVSIAECDELAGLGGIGPGVTVRSLTLTSNDALTGLGALATATDFGELYLYQNPLLTDIAALSGVTSVERLDLSFNSRLADLAGLAALEEVVGNVSIGMNPALDQCAAEALVAELAVGGSVVVEHNGPCR